MSYLVNTIVSIRTAAYTGKVLILSVKGCFATVQDADGGRVHDVHVSRIS